MTFVLSKIVWFLVQPLNLIVLLILAGPLFNALRWRRLGALAWQTGLALLVTATVLPVGQMLLIPIENRFAPLTALPERVDGIVVLGGAASPDLTEARGSVALLSGAERLTEAVRLANHYPEARVVFSGGSSDVVGPGRPEADTARRFFAEQGLAAERVIFETGSRNTWENALNTLERVRPAPGERWLLVTSAFHMPRSVGIFRRVGWEVVPYPVDFRTEGQLSVRGFDFLDRMDELDLAIKEWVGLIAYYAMDRTTGLLPGPR